MRSNAMFSHQSPVKMTVGSHLKRDRNSHVIAFCRVGSATRNKYLIFYLHDIGKLCKRIIKHEVEAAGYSEAVAARPN